jgi:hypothetical protein
MGEVSAPSRHTEQRTKSKYVSILAHCSGRVYRQKCTLLSLGSTEQTNI